MISQFKMLTNYVFAPGRESGSGYQNGDSERWQERGGEAERPERSERWGSERGGGARGGSASGGGGARQESRDVRRDEDFVEPPPPRNDRWKEPEPRSDQRSGSRWPSDDVRRTATSSNRRDEV